MRTKLASAVLAILLVTGGAAAVSGGGVVGNAAADVNTDATYQDGTVSVTLTADGTPLEGVNVSAEDRDVGTTDANGTVTFETDASEDRDLELVFEGSEFEGEQEYRIENGSLVLLSEEFEYGPEADADEERDKEDADQEREDVDEEREDDEELEDEAEEEREDADEGPEEDEAEEEREDVDEEPEDEDAEETEEDDEERED